MLIINPRTVNFMSTVIGICGENFCVFVGDKRKTRPSDDEQKLVVVDDSTDKVFKLNDQLLFGYVGEIRTWESIVQPFNEVKDKSKLSVNKAERLIKAHVNDLRDRGLLFGIRNYLLAGIDSDGAYFMKRICYSGGEMKDKKYKPDFVHNNLCHEVLLPPRLVPKKEYYNQRLNEKIQKSRGVFGVANAAESLIREIADADNSVSKNCTKLIIYK